MLLSVQGETVKYVAGNTLYTEDQDGFLLREFPADGSVSARQATWLIGLTRYEIPFCMGFAGALAQSPADTVSTCPFLERFSYFYCAHRTHAEAAARELRHVLESLFAFQRWPAIYRVLMDAMGDQASAVLPKGLSPIDIGFFLGRLLTGGAERQLTLAGLPAAVRTIRNSEEEHADCLRMPQYRRLLDNLERSTERSAQQLEDLGEALKHYFFRAS